MLARSVRARAAVLGICCVAAVRLGATGARADDTTPPESKGPANVQAVDGSGLKKAVDAERGKAKVVLVNLWATWCQPCVSEFPDLVKLYNNYKARGVVLLSASIDEPEDRAKVDTFITEQKALFPVYLRQAGTVEQFLDPFDRKWEGIVPTTYVFNQRGKQDGAPIIGIRTYAQYESRIKPLLK